MVVANRYSLSEQVRNHILAKIARGELAPGDRLVEYLKAQMAVNSEKAN
jgi:DNA-binding GntR family transcriptional regulator